MKPKLKIGHLAVGVIDVILLAICLIQIFHPLFSFGNFGLFNAKGVTAQAQARLIVAAVLLMFVIVLPVLITGFYIAFKYRAQAPSDGANGQADKQEAYDPDWGERHKYLQIIWWLCPALIIFLLSILNFQSAHKLDPFNAIVSKNPPLTIEVVALQWKWLFIYPAQNIATINYIDIPQNVPVHFELTADAPMSLFWIPQLGGEMAAMAGMVNQINLMATQTGQFTGQNSEINGTGYDGMKFTVNSTSQTDFSAWVASLKKNSPMLTEPGYNKLAQPTQNNPPAYYGSVDQSLYNNVVMKFMTPQNATDMPGLYLPVGASTNSMDDMMPGMEMK